MRNAFYASALTMLLMTPAAALADSVCGDVNDSGTVTSSDAQAVLRNAVGQNVDLVCAPSGGLQATGQTTCYNAFGAPLSCLGSGQDGQLRLGLERIFTDNGDGTVTDEVNGLTWEKLSDDGSIHDKDNKFSWGEVLENKITQLNEMNFAGYDDWRLPNRFELDSLVNLGTSLPATYSAFNQDCAGGCTVLTCSCTRPDYYWSSSTYIGSPTYAWTVYFNAGDTYASLKTLLYHYRAVRGGS